MSIEASTTAIPARRHRPLSTPATLLGFAPLVAMMIAGAGAALAAPAGPGLGQTIPIDEIAQISIHVFPNGMGLPTGQGTVEQGEGVYRQRCASCHGPKGQGASAEELAGAGKTLTDEPPDKTIGTYWPYATTLFDFIQRSMPLNAPRSLSTSEVYAVTAYLLYLNGIIDQDRRLDAASLAGIRMPNRQGFISAYPGKAH